MEMLRSLSNNALVATVVGILLTTFFSGVGFLIKKIMDINKREKEIVNQNNIIQNFSNGINYSDVEKIAESVFEREMLKMKKQ